MRRRRGYMLVEMLAIILLLGASAIVVTRTTTLILRVYRDVPAASATLRAQQQWLGTLRDDAWAASSIHVDAASVRLGDVHWTYADGTLRRVTGDDARRWPVSRPIKWRWDGALLDVTSDGDAVPLMTPAYVAKEPA